MERSYKSVPLGAHNRAALNSMGRRKEDRSDEGQLRVESGGMNLRLHVKSMRGII